MKVNIGELGGELLVNWEGINSLEDLIETKGCLLYTSRCV